MRQLTARELAVAISVRLHKQGICYIVAVVVGDDETQAAHELLTKGAIDGYVAVSESSAGLVVMQRTRAADLDTDLAARLHWLDALGGHEVPSGASA